MFTVLLYILQRILNLRNNDMSVHIFMVICLVLIGIALYQRHKKKILDSTDIEIAIITVGIIMRLGYMLYTPGTLRSQDMWRIEPDGHGHAGYLLGLILNHRLPDTNALQCYQQPMYYIFSALISVIVNFPFGFDDYFSLIDAAKLISFYASVITLVFIRNIMNDYNVRSPFARIIALSIPTFMPVGFMIAGRVAPDSLALMFMVLAFYYTNKWYENNNMKYTVLLAIIYGLGVSTKISVGVLAIYTSFVFVYKFIKTKKKSALLLKFAVFGIISLPTGLWFSIRNYLKFGQKLTYVLDQGTDSFMYVGDVPLLNRFIIPNFQTLTDPFLELEKQDYNAIIAYIKSSLFGVFPFQFYTWLAYPLLIVSIILFVIVTIAVVYHIIKLIKEKKGLKEWSLVFVTALFLSSMIIFYIKYPQICSLDFRYYVFLTVPVMIIFAKVLEREETVKLRIIIAGVTLLYCFLSFFFCLTLYGVNEMIEPLDLQYFFSEE